MRRAFLFLFIYLISACSAWAQFAQPLLLGGGGGGGGGGGAPPPPTVFISSVTACSGSNSCSFTPGSTNAIGQAAATLSNQGTFAGSWSMPTSGTATNPAGASCPDNSAAFTISSAGLLASTAASASQAYSVCISASQSGLGAPNPYIQVVSLSPANTIACDLGKPYTGAIPAGAVRAGYTHCAVNMDFAQFNNASEFVDCLGATSPLLYFDTTNPKQTPCDTSHMLMVSDGGSNSFQMKFLTTDVANRNINQLFSWKKSGSQALHAYTGWTVPEGYYIEDVWRVAHNYSAMSGNFGGNTVGVYVYGPYFYQPATTSCGIGQGSFFEVDMDESFGNGSINANAPFLTSGNCSGFPAPTNGGYKFGHDSFQLVPTGGCCKYPSPQPNFNNYYTWGQRLTGNGSSSEGDCTYIDAGIVNGSQNAASQVFCQNMTNLPTITQTDGTWTSRTGLFFAALFYGNTHVTSMTGDIAINVKRMTIWSCAAWRDDNSRLDQGSINNECYPGLLTGTP